MIFYNISEKDSADVYWNSLINFAYMRLLELHTYCIVCINRPWFGDISYFLGWDGTVVLVLSEMA